MWIKVYQKRDGAEGQDLEVMSDYLVKYIPTHKIYGFEIDETDDGIYHICLDLGNKEAIVTETDTYGRVLEQTIPPIEYFYDQDSTEVGIIKKANAFAELLNKNKAGGY